MYNASIGRSTNWEQRTVLSIGEHTAKWSFLGKFLSVSNTPQTAKNIISETRGISDALGSGVSHIISQHTSLSGQLDECINFEVQGDMSQLKQDQSKISLLCSHFLLDLVKKEYNTNEIEAFLLLVKNSSKDDREKINEILQITSQNLINNLIKKNPFSPETERLINEVLNVMENCSSEKIATTNESPSDDCSGVPLNPSPTKKIEYNHIQDNKSTLSFSKIFMGTHEIDNILYDIEQKLGYCDVTAEKEKIWGILENKKIELKNYKATGITEMWPTIERLQEKIDTLENEINTALELNEQFDETFKKILPQDQINIIKLHRKKLSPEQMRKLTGILKYKIESVFPSLFSNGKTETKKFNTHNMILLAKILSLAAQEDYKQYLFSFEYEAIIRFVTGKSFSFSMRMRSEVITEEIAKLILQKLTGRPSEQIIIENTLKYISETSEKEDIEYIDKLFIKFEMHEGIDKIKAIIATKNKLRHLLSEIEEINNSTPTEIIEKKIKKIKETFEDIVSKSYLSCRETKQIKDRIDMFEAIIAKNKLHHLLLEMEEINKHLQRDALIETTAERTKEIQKIYADILPKLDLSDWNTRHIKERFVKIMTPFDIINSRVTYQQLFKLYDENPDPSQQAVCPISLNPFNRNDLVVMAILIETDKKIKKLIIYDYYKMLDHIKNHYKNGNRNSLLEPTTRQPLQSAPFERIEKEHPEIIGMCIKNNLPH